MTKKKESIVIGVDVRERLQVARLMPEKGNYFDMIVGKHIEKKFELTSEEIQVIGLKNTSTGITWDPNKEVTKEVELTPTEIEFLKVRVNELSDLKELPFNMVGLCEKIMAN